MARTLPRRTPSARASSDAAFTASTVSRSGVSFYNVGDEHARRIAGHLSYNLFSQAYQFYVPNGVDENSFVEKTV